MLNILVICTGNSCRSIISEALFNHLGNGRIKAFSAGSQPLGRLNAGAIALLQRHGIATEGFSSKSWEAFENQPIDIVITVCDNAAGETCPVYLRSMPGRIGACPIRVMSRAQMKRLKLRLKPLTARWSGALTKCWPCHWKICPARHLSPN